MTCAMETLKLNVTALPRIRTLPADFAFPVDIYYTNRAFIALGKIIFCMLILNGCAISGQTPI